MIITRTELARQGFEPRATGLLKEVLETAGDFINSDTKEARLYQETELEDGIEPETYYLFTRK